MIDRNSPAGPLPSKLLKLVELDAAQLARSLPDVAAGAVNDSYAVQAGPGPARDTILVEPVDKLYRPEIGSRTWCTRAQNHR